MERSLKFRAYDTKENKWLLGYEYSNLGGFSLFGEIMLLGEWSKILDQYIFERNGHKQEDLKVMQFSGVHDFHGKPIYEGDIVSTGEEIGEVQYDPLQAAFIILFYPHNKKQKSGCANLASTWPSPLKEIQGNIYENTELTPSTELEK